MTDHPMTVHEAIAARRSVRAYDGRKLDPATVRMLLDAAVRAPSAMNEQPWLFAVVQDHEQLRRYSNRAKYLLLAQAAADPKARRYEDLLLNPEYDIFYDAGTLVVIASRHEGPFAQADGWLAAENLMLAACAAGLGTCCIGFAVALLQHPEVKRELGLPPEAVAVAPIIVGYPRVVPPVVFRREPRIVSWSGRSG